MTTYDFSQPYTVDLPLVRQIIDWHNEKIEDWEEKKQELIDFQQRFTNHSNNNNSAYTVITPRSTKQVAETAKNIIDNINKVLEKHLFWKENMQSYLHEQEEIQHAGTQNFIHIKNSIENPAT